MRQPPRRWMPVRLVCRECGQPIRPGEFGGWDHVRRQKVKDPTWHRAEAA